MLNNFKERMKYYPIGYSMKFCKFCKRETIHKSFDSYVECINCNTKTRF